MAAAHGVPQGELPPRVCLIGFMGCGKSTVGPLLAARLGWPFLDLDAAIEEEAGRPIPEIFRLEGEQAFREREHRALAGLAHRRRLVLAAGGGAPVPERNRPFFREPIFTVYLEVSFTEFRRRVGAAPGRPLLARPPEELRRLYASRIPIYRELGRPVRTDGRRPVQVVDEILALLAPASGDADAGAGRR